jgi:hypothetical protein
MANSCARRLPLPTIPAERFAVVTYLSCGAAGQGIRSGPCFQPIGAAWQARARAGGSEQNCRAACQSQPQAAQGQCVQRCMGGTGVQVGQQLAGRVPCKFQGELVNRCGAVAMAIGRHPSALVMTSDISTQLLNLATTGQGATQQAAEAQAMEQCRRAEGPGVQGRIVASGC